MEWFSKFTKPITTLQANGIKYEWIEECDVTFNDLKIILISAPILFFPDMDKDFTVCKCKVCCYTKTCRCW